MLRHILLLTFIAISFSSCTIVGHYYLINASENKIKVSIEYDARFIYLGRKIEVKSSEYRKKKKVKFSAYKKMRAHPYSIDSLTSTLFFELDKNQIAHLGWNNNAREIGEIKIEEKGQIYNFDSGKAKFKSRGLMKYVMLYKYD